MGMFHGPQDRRALTFDAKKGAKPIGRRGRPPKWDDKKKTRVERVITFVENLPITKGILAGELMRLLPGQRQFIEAVYGRLNDRGRRQIKLAIKSEPRGNGKTGLLAALALAHLCGPEAEPRGEVYSCAYNKLQAALIFAEMKAIVQAVPAFAQRININRFNKILEVVSGPGQGSIFESLSADDKRAHGLSPTLWIYDEFAQAPNSDLLDNLRTAMGKRKESLGVIISTQAANDMHPLSVLIDDAAQVSDPAIYVQIAAAPAESDIFDEAVWHGCNEALGKFLDLAELQAQAEQAKRLVGFRAKFQNLRLNQRIDAAAQFLEDPVWMECAGAVDPRALAGKPCYAGLDLSTTTDMSALVLYWPHNGAVLPYFWLPAEGLYERDRKEGGHYRAWREQGLLETTPGAAINFSAIIHRLASISKEFDLKCVAYDRAFMGMFRGRCLEEGVEFPMAEFGQGYVSMAPAVQALEAAIRDKQLRHGGHPILRWQVANAAVETDPHNNRKITKKRSTGHVDGLIALLMAIGIHNLKRVPEGEYSLTFV
jgi:phage terminase large subunit-like protein